MKGIETNQMFSIEQVKDQYFGSKKTTNVTKSGLDFAEILKQSGKTDDITNSEVQFSKHASNRLQERNIELTQEQMERLNEGLQLAMGKGIKDSLIMVDELAFIVNVPNNTVVTALDATAAEDKVFTNIDGAVIM